MQRQFPTSLLLATDGLASPLLEAGAVTPTGSAAYTPYGYRPGGAKGMQSRIGFTGQFLEPEIGWYMLGNGHRAYNPILMRFHSPDQLSPFGAGGLNAYAYCQGDPINFRDPSGRDQTVGGMLNMVMGALGGGPAISLYHKLLTIFYNHRAKAIGVPQEDLGQSPSAVSMLVDVGAIGSAATSFSMGTPLAFNGDTPPTTTTVYDGARETASVATAALAMKSATRAKSSYQGYKTSKNAYLQKKRELAGGEPLGLQSVTTQTTERAANNIAQAASSAVSVGALGRSMIEDVSVVGGTLADATSGALAQVSDAVSQVREYYV